MMQKSAPGAVEYKRGHAVMKENAHFFHFLFLMPFPSFPISSFLVPDFTSFRFLDDHSPHIMYSGHIVCYAVSQGLAH